MNYLDAIILGIVQGLTEFLPVSSSGHLVLAQEILHVNLPGVAFEIIVHLGTLLAVLIYYRSTFVDLTQSIWTPSRREDRKTVLYLILASIPAAVLGLALKSTFEEAFGSPSMTSVFLLVTGVILLASKLFRNSTRPVGLKAAIVMGCGQAVAILPGVSRSGSTIVSGMAVGSEPSAVAKFSFLMSVPVILGATVLELDHLSEIPAELMSHYAVAFAVSFGTGLLAIHSLLAIVKRGKFSWFAWYCFAVGALGLYLFL
ncbi:MAG: undecaprenyl-diphosphate phosphatase [Candidatus Zixiibacteriota bacterium]